MTGPVLVAIVAVFAVAAILFLCFLVFLYGKRKNTRVYPRSNPLLGGSSTEFPQTGTDLEQSKGKSEVSSELDSDEPESPKYGLMSHQSSLLIPTSGGLTVQTSDDLSTVHVSGSGMKYQFEAAPSTRNTLADLRIKTQPRRDMPMSRSKSGLF